MLIPRDRMNIALCVLYFGVLSLLLAYGVHRGFLVVLCRFNRRRLEEVISRARYLDTQDESELPRVTIQLPLFNESTVVGRLLNAVAQMDYPASRLEIQVLDDSIDETQALARSHVERLRAQGLDIVYLHRTCRTGYKAGALERGMQVAKGEFIAIFDADFLPQPDFVRRVIDHFRDPKIAMVQTRWGHMNREFSALTKVQALQLDGHHLVENRARFGANYLFNFSGTGGIWRKSAIIDAGGWQHDTLTEDLDLSYRAQLRGWRFIYRPDVVTPSELPEEVSAVRAQQYRWAKGTVQVARKLMGRIMRSDISIGQRAEAFFHLTPHFAYPLLVMLSVLLLPMLLVMPGGSNMMMLTVDLPLLAATTGSLAAFYMEAERAQGRSRLGAMLRMPMLIAVGTGLAPHLAKAVIDGMRQMSGEFVRTPKQGSNRARYKMRSDMPLAEIILALISFASVIASVQNGHWFATPFAILFTAGYGYVAVLVSAEQAGRRRALAAMGISSDRPAPEASSPISTREELTAAE